jgi:hypothetical protein
VDGNWYTIQFYCAINAGSAAPEIRNTALGTIDGPLIDATSMTLTRLTIIKGAAIPFIRLGNLSAGELFYIDALEVLPLSDLFALRPQAFVDAYAQVRITRTDYTQAGIAHYADADNFVIAYLNGDNKVKLVKCVAGVYTEVGSANITYGAGKLVKFSRSGTTYKVYYDGVEKISQTIADSAFASAKAWGLFSTYDGNSFDDYEWGAN